MAKFIQSLVKTYSTPWYVVVFKLMSPQRRTSHSSAANIVIKQRPLPGEVIGDMVNIKRIHRIRRPRACSLLKCTHIVKNSLTALLCLYSRA